MCDAIYHACRLAFNAGCNGVDWHYVLHALREGLGMEQYITHRLTEEELNKYPELRELMQQLRDCTKVNNDAP